MFERSEYERSGDNLKLTLRNGNVVTIAQDFYDDILSIGLPDYSKWTTNKGIVYVHYKGKAIPITRIICYTPRGWRIDYFDKNSLNLVKGNLVTAFDGKSKHDYREIVTGKAWCEG